MTLLPCPHVAGGDKGYQAKTGENKASYLISAPIAGGGGPCVSLRHGCRHGFQINGETAELMLLSLDDEFLSTWYFKESDQGATRFIRRTKGDNRTMSFCKGDPR